MHRLSISPSPNASFSLRIALLALAVAVIVAVVHWPVLSAQTISFDDDPYLFANPALMNPSWDNAIRVLTDVLRSSNVRGYYEGLTLASLMGDVALGGSRTNLRPFHRTSLALHVLNTALVFVLLQLLFGKRWAAAGAALLFGLHPLTVEPVAWVWERKTLLATVLAVGSMIAYVLYTRREGLLRYLSALGMFVLALAAKPSVLPLPILLILLDWWPLRRIRRADRTALPGLGLEKIPFLLVAGASALITIASTGRNAMVAMPGEFSLALALLRVGYLLVFYLAKVVCPIHLSSVYILPSPGSAIYFVAAALVVGLMAVALLFARRVPALPAGLLFFIIAIGPTLGLIQYSWVAASDKYVYFPMLGLVLFVTWGLSRAIEAGRGLGIRVSGVGDSPLETANPKPQTRYPMVAAALVVALAIAEAAATRYYLDQWQTTEQFFRYMLRQTPQSDVLHTHLAWHLMREGRESEALAEYAQALRINPYAADPHYNLGLIALDRKRPDEAVEHFRAAVAAKPNDFSARMKLGQALFEQQQFAPAAAEFEQALGLDPASALAHRNFGRALVALKRPQEAMAAFRNALQIQPDADTYVQLGDLLEEHNRRKQAITAYHYALQLSPNHAAAQQRLRELSDESATSSAPLMEPVDSPRRGMSQSR